MLAALVGLAPEAAMAAPGELTQLSGPLGCVSVSGGQCARGRAIGEPFDVAVSPDGRHAYVASVKHNAIAAFARGRGGALRQLRGTRGCIRHRGGLGCARGRALADPWQVRVSPDGRNVYAASRTSHVLAVFRRDRRSGALRQLPGAAGCLSQFGGSGCGRARAIAGAAAIRVSPDGANVYVASVGSDAVAVFRRRPSNGALEQLPGASGCVSRAGGGGCARGRALDNAIDAALSRDGRHVYIASARSNGIAIFSRGPDGALVQAPGPEGCISQAGEDGCASGRTLRELLSVVVSPDGNHVYAGAAGAVGVLRRDPATGSLVQPAGALGCVSEAAQGCERARSAHDVTWIALSPSGAHLYLASFGRVTMGAFSRSLGSGALDELAGRAGCAGPVSYLGCRRARSVRNILSLTVSPDGRNLYTASTGSNAVAVFRRAR
ncbi:MAG TPA: beta-propeller fold lactonase family protein [Thermoleophilaceae bacterium]|nr:beta-propeller fold lactonase family protein [Thermoleophilaceae bacterium]